MWKLVENSSSEKPSEIDSTTSEYVVYVRQNFTHIDAAEDVPEHYSFDEQTITKSDWETYNAVMSDTDTVADMAFVNSELALALIEETGE